jgi:hypothetical protein
VNLYIGKGKKGKEYTGYRNMGLGLGFMLFNATFNSISWWTVLMVDKQECPEKTTDLPQVTDKLYNKQVL